MNVKQFVEKFLKFSFDSAVYIENGEDFYNIEVEENEDLGFVVIRAKDTANV